MKVTPDFKMVIILDDTLPTGLQCNTAAVLSLTLGKKIDNLIDRDLVDGSGNIHVGLTNQPLPILKSTKEHLKELLKQAKDLSNNMLVVDITDAAQTTKNYTDYEEKLRNMTSEKFTLLGIALAGSQKDIKSLTGSLPLLK